MPTNGTQYVDICLSSESPQIGEEGQTWFDNVGIIEWEEWQPLNRPINIPTPNDFYWVQIRTNEETNNAVLSSQEIDYNPHSMIADKTNRKISFKSLQCFPNPFTKKTVISWVPEAHRGSASSTQAVEIHIYNSMGRLVTSHKPPVTSNYFVWDGKDNQGRLLGSGIYFCRLQANGYEQSRKIVLLK
jgi:hypothetical protein